MALAPLGYALFTRHMKHDPADPSWPDRDRFVLSCGHASMLLYSCLYLSGYDARARGPEAVPPVGEPHAGASRVRLHRRRRDHHRPARPGRRQRGRAWRSPRRTSRRCSIATGMAIVDHYTYFICSDGDLMEGISHEAASFAGHFKLGKLIGFYDDNRITIDGSTDLTFSDDTAQALRGVRLAGAAPRRRERSRRDRPRWSPRRRPTPSRPTLVVTRTHIGFGSPKKQDTAKAHGEPLGADEIVRDEEGARLAEAGRAVLRAGRSARALAQGARARRRGARGVASAARRVSRRVRRRRGGARAAADRRAARRIGTR